MTTVRNLIVRRTMIETVMIIVVTTTKTTTKSTTTTMLRTCLSKKGGLDSEGSVWSVELNTSQLWGLQLQA